MILTRQQKADLVIKLAGEGKNTRDIAQAVHISLKDIGTIIRRHLGEEENETEYPNKALSMNSRSFKLFKKCTNLVDVAIVLNIDTVEVLGIYSDYLRLLNLQKLIIIYNEIGNDINLLENLYHDLKIEGLANKQDIFNIVQMAGKLRSLNSELYSTAEDISRLNSAKFQLERDVEELQKKVDHYDSLLLERWQYQASGYP